MFCAYKNKQLYNDTKREIVESANISYDFYLSPKFDINELEQWQRDILESRKLKLKG